MINNRQANRRRGRNNNNNNNNNNNRGPGNNRGSGGGDRDNRIDNRTRGNALQMLEKYKKLAQDAQVDGDRVQAEYYHQFVDHYFRVHADTQARREEYRRQREERHENYAQQERYDDFAPDSDEGIDASDGNDREPGNPRGQRDAAAENRPQPAVKAPRPREIEAGEASVTDAPVSSADGEDGGKEEARKPARRPRSRRPAAANGRDDADEAGSSNAIAAHVLPPAIGELETKPKPVRRRRAPAASKLADGDVGETGAGDSAEDIAA